MTSKRYTQTPHSIGVVLGVDPGYGRCGIAVVGPTAHGEALHFSTTISTPAGDPFPVRLRAVADAVRACIATYTPERIALERLFFTTNQKTAMHVAEVRGALLLIAAEAELSIEEYGPGEVKLAICGDGRGDKRAVARMIHHLLRLPEATRHDDEYDAIAVALTARAVGFRPR